MSGFRFAGTYRVQSKKVGTYSELEGMWYPQSPSLLDSGRVNNALRNSPLWKSTAFVQMTPAKVHKRIGQFASEPDILYKKQFFSPADGSPDMEVDIVDVEKSVHNWNNRRAFMVELCGEDTYEQVEEILCDLEGVIANEYYLHEAGHFLGYDVLAKYAEGYFTVGGRMAWPLVYVEEFRADLHAFGFALNLLPKNLSAQIFLYNLLLRFGVHAEGVQTKNIESYGLVPFLLFNLLRKIGFINVNRRGPHSKLDIVSLDEDYITEVMKSCDDHAGSELTDVEVTSTDKTDIAINAASYVRRCVSDGTALKEFHEVIGSIQSHP